MIILLIVVIVALVFAGVVVYRVTKAEKKNKLQWETHLWQKESEEKEKELEDLDILFEDIWGDMHDEQ